jgi:hypothetical protein
MCTHTSSSLVSILSCFSLSSHLYTSHPHPSHPLSCPALTPNREPVPGQEGTSVTLDMLQPGAGGYTATLQRRLQAAVDHANAEAANVLVDQ